MAEVDHEVHEIPGVVLRHGDAIPPPPSPLEAAALAKRNGLDAAKNAFISRCRKDDVPSCVDADRFNAWGYNLLGQQRPRDAIAVFQLNAWAHHQSANAQDSLADGLLSINDQESAKRAVERAIALVPEDQTLEPAAKLSLTSEENAKLQRIK